MALRTDRRRRLRDALDDARVLYREKSFGDDDVKENRKQQRSQRDQQRNRLEPKDELQRPAIERDHPLESALRGSIDAPLLLLRAGAAGCAHSSWA